MLDPLRFLFAIKGDVSTPAGVARGKSTINNQHRDPAPQRSAKEEQYQSSYPRRRKLFLL
jgi:hypothetical protein